MRRFSPGLVPAAAAIALAGCGGSRPATNPTASALVAAKGTAVVTTPATATAATGATVRVRTTKLGRILVGPRGRSLYLFERDSGAASTCYGACAAEWPPLIVRGAAHAGPGVAAAKLGGSRRTDGEIQVTYSGHPLYYFVRDTAAGQTRGEGLTLFGGGWDVLAPSGKKIEKPGK